MSDPGGNGASPAAGDWDPDECPRCGRTECVCPGDYEDESGDGLITNPPWAADYCGVCHTKWAYFGCTPDKCGMKTCPTCGQVLPPGTR